MNLSEHFTLEELTTTGTGLPNTPPADLLPRLYAVANCLEQVRSLFAKPITITSGYRSDAVNKAVGGSTTSAHSIAYAADFWVPGMTPTEVCKAIAASDIEYDQLIDEMRGLSSWVHISIDPRMRGQNLTFRNGKYTPGFA